MISNSIIIVQVAQNLYRFWILPKPVKLYTFIVLMLLNETQPLRSNLCRWHRMAVIVTFKIIAESF